MQAVMSAASSAGSAGARASTATGDAPETTSLSSADRSAWGNGGAPVLTS